MSGMAPYSTLISIRPQDVVSVGEQLIKGGEIEAALIVLFSQESRASLLIL
jgi:hypothetical protein